MFSKKTGSFRKVLKSAAKECGWLPENPCEMIYVTAPHELPEPDNDGQKAFTWVYWLEEEHWDSCSRYIGLEESLAFIKGVIRFDGVLGFSQGGVLASILCGLRGEEDVNFSFAMIFSAFKSPVPDVRTRFLSKEALLKGGELLTIHSWGKKDELIPAASSSELFDTFSDAFPTQTSKLTHPGGHVIPTDSLAKVELRAFFKKLTDHLALQQARP